MSTLHQETIREILLEKNGFAIGEDHNSRAALNFLIENMKSLKEMGVKTLGLEIFKEEWSGQDLVGFNRSGQLNESLADRIAFLDLKYAVKEHPTFKDTPTPLTELREMYYRWKISPQTEAAVSEMLLHESKQNYNYSKLLKVAHECDIKVIAIDSSQLNIDDFDSRIAKMNEFAVNAIKRKAGNGKFVTLTGAGHTQGISESLDIPDIHVLESPVERVLRNTPVKVAGKILTPQYAIVTRVREPSNLIGLKKS